MGPEWSGLKSSSGENTGVPRRLAELPGIQDMGIGLRGLHHCRLTGRRAPIVDWRNGLACRILMGDVV